MPKIIRYVSYKMRTEKEVLNRFEKEFEEINSEKVKNEIFKYLYENEFLNDERYAELFLKEAMKFKRNSIFELKMKLREKGIDQDYIKNAINDLEDELNLFEYNLILKLAKEKMRQTKDILKTKAYLYRKGFNSNNINNAFMDLNFEEN